MKKVKAKSGLFNTGLQTPDEFLNAKFSPYQIAAWVRWYAGDKMLLNLLVSHPACPESIKNKYLLSRSSNAQMGHMIESMLVEQEVEVPQVEASKYSNWAQRTLDGISNWLFK